MSDLPGHSWVQVTARGGRRNREQAGGAQGDVRPQSTVRGSGGQARGPAGPRLASGNGAGGVKVIGRGSGHQKNTVIISLRKVRIPVGDMLVYPREDKIHSFLDSSPKVKGGEDGENPELYGQTRSSCCFQGGG